MYVNHAAPEKPTADPPGPELSLAELRVIEFEIKAAAANGAVSSMTDMLRRLRAERIQTNVDLEKFKPAGYRGEAEKHRLKVVENLTLELARIEAKIIAAESERSACEEHARPLKSLASKMREEFERRSAQDRATANAAKKEVPRQLSPNEAAALAKYSGGPTDDLSRPLPVEGQIPEGFHRADGSVASKQGQAIARAVGAEKEPAAKVTLGSTAPEWIQRLHSQAYGGTDGQ